MGDTGLTSEAVTSNIGADTAERRPPFLDVAPQVDIESKV